LEHRKEIDYPVIPASFNKNGSLSKKSSVLSDEELKVLSQYATHKVEQIGKEILDGNIDAEPYQLGEQNPCVYCPYGGICGFDENLPGFKYKSLEKLSNEDLIRNMKEEV
jgi:ATP-dependent helicase/nuclease subunit B